MLNPIGALRNIFIVVVLVMVLFAATKYSPDVKGTLSSVLGASTESNKKEVTEFTEGIQKDVTKHAEDVKEQGLETTVREAMGTVERGKKILDDFHNLQEEIRKKVEEAIK